MLPNNIQLANQNKYFKLHFIIFLWGLTPVLGKLITIPALDLVFWRLSFSILSLGAFVWYKNIKYQLNVKQLTEILALGLVVGAHWYFFYHAIKVSNVAIAMAGFSTITLFASILQPFLLKKKFFWGDALYGVIIIVGLLFILSVESGAFLGIFYGILAAFSGAFFGVYNGKLIVKHDSSVITMIEFLGALVFIVISKFVISDYHFELISLSTSNLIWLLILSIFCTTIAFTMSVEIMKFFTPFTVIMTNNLEPIYGVLISLFIFGESEKMSNQFYFGAIIIMICVFTYPIFKKKLDKQ